MGMYPSADLMYGIDLGMDEERDRPDWFTEELEAEHGDETEVLDVLLKNLHGIYHHWYGNASTGYGGLALCTQSVGASAYKAVPVGIDRLTATVQDDAILQIAWGILYPDTVRPEPGWFLTVSYG